MREANASLSTPDRSVQRNLLVRLMDEQSLVWRQGNSVAVEEYLKRYSHLAGDTELVLDLIYNEVVQRQKRGEHPRLDEYVQRFPHLSDPLKIQFEVHNALEARSVLPSLSGRWFVARGREKVGPFELEVLQSLVRDGSLKEKDMVLPEGGSKWGPAGDIPGLFASLAAETTNNILSSVAVGTETRSFIPDALSPLQSPENFVPRSSPGIPGMPGYELLGELGRGGMGVVYKARQTALKRLVALKMILSRGHASSGELERFQAEAEAVARLQHPNIVQIYEVGRQGEQPYFSLEFVDGGSLDRKIAGTPQSPRDAAALMEPIARAMYAAHQAGVIHRDLKPANILLARPAPEQVKQGQEPSLGEFVPKISDFGLAKRLDESGLTMEGAVMGTPSYMSPEQARGKINQLGPTTDIWALGAILYELMTGRPPFKGRNIPDTLMLVQTSEPVAPRELTPQTPRDLETICLKCLQKEPEKRYASALELSLDLSRFLRGEPIKARPVSRVERVYHWGRRNPVPASLAILLVLSLVGGVTGVLWYLGVALENEKMATDEKNNAQAETRRANQNEIQATEAKQRAEQEADQWRTITYASFMAKVSDARDRGDLAAMQRYLSAFIPKPGEKDLRNFVWHAHWQSMRASKYLLHGHDSGVNSLAYSPDGSLLASCGLDMKVFIWDMKTGTPLWKKPLSFDFNPSEIAFSADGKQVLVLVDQSNHLRVFDVGNGTEGNRFPIPECGCFAVSPDGETVAIGTYQNSVILLDADRKVKRFEIKDPHKGGVNFLHFSHDGKLLYSLGNDERLRSWKIEGTGAARKAVAFSASEGYRVNPRVRFTLTPLSQTLIAVGPDNLLLSYDVGGDDNLKQHATVIGRHAGGVTALAAVGGQTVTAVGGSQAVPLWSLFAKAESGRLAGHLGFTRAVAATRDGRQLATAGHVRGIRVWDVQGPLSGPAGAAKDGTAFVTSEPLLKPPENNSGSIAGSDSRMWRGKGGSIRALAFSPTEDLLASSGEDGIVRFWNAATGERIRSVYVAPYACPGIAFTPDGKTLVVAEPTGTYLRLNVAKHVPVNPESAGVFGSTLSTMALSPNGKLAVFGTNEGQIAFENLTSSDPHHSPFGKHHHRLTLSTFSPDGKYAALAGEDAIITLHELPDPKAETQLVTTRPMQYAGKPATLAFTPDSKHLFCSSSDRTVRLLDLNGRQRILTHTHSPYVAVAAAPDGKTLYWASRYGRSGDLVIWNDVALPKFKEQKRIPIFPTTPTAVAVSRDGKKVALGCSRGTIALWDVEKKRVAERWPGHACAVLSLSRSPDGKTLAQACADFVVRVVDLRTARVIKELEGHKDVVTAVAHSPVGGLLASASHDGTIRLWDAITGEPRATWRLPRSAALCLRFTPDGKSLVTGGGTIDSRGELTVWDVASGTVRRSLNGHRWMVRQLVVAEDGKRLVSASGTEWDYPGEIKLWDLEAGHELASASGHRLGISSLALAPDGRTLATGGREGHIRLWDIGDTEAPLKPTGELVGHQGNVWEIAFLPDGRTLASVGADQTLRYWHGDLGMSLGLQRFHSRPLCMEVIPEGPTIYVGMSDGTLSCQTRISEEELAFETRFLQEQPGDVLDLREESERFRVDALLRFARGVREETEKPKALEAFRDARQLLETMVARQPGDSFLQRELLDVLLELAGRRAGGTLAESEACCRKAREIIDAGKFAVRGEAEFLRLRAFARRLHADCLVEMGRIEEGAGLSEDALGSLSASALNGPFAHVDPPLFEEECRVRFQRCRLLKLTGKLEEARKLCEDTFLHTRGKAALWGNELPYWDYLIALTELELTLPEKIEGIHFDKLFGLLELYEERTLRDPSDLKIREAYARAYGRRADILWGSKNLVAVADHYRATHSLWKALQLVQPNRAETWSETGYATERVGRILLLQKEYAKARSHAELAVRDQAKARQLAPADGRCPERLASHFDLLAEACLNLNEYEEAVKAVKERVAVEKETAANRRRLAGLMAEAATKAGADVKQTQVERKAKSEEYADEAMRLLTRAFALGYKDQANLEKEVDLAPLRGRDDFKTLLKSLDRGKP